MKDYLMNTYNRKKVSFTRGDGVYLWDSEGKKYLDALCGLAVTGLGHSHPEISKVIYNQSQTLIHTSNAFIIEQQKSLAKRSGDNNSKSNKETNWSLLYAFYVVGAFLLFIGIKEKNMILVLIALVVIGIGIAYRKATYDRGKVSFLNLFWPYS